MLEHSFTKRMKEVLIEDFGKDKAATLMETSLLLQYLNVKTKSAASGSKSRGSFANLYAIYVLVEDYIEHEFHLKAGYRTYAGARFTDLFARQRQLPFGKKLQNHALNDRLNGEFRKYFPAFDSTVIMRDGETNRYWINENLLIHKQGKRPPINFALSVIRIIDEYVKAKQSSFDAFIDYCEGLINVGERKGSSIVEFIISQLAPNADARIFEIVSYSILKFHYRDQAVYFGFDLKSIQKERLSLYKTGRTNANDGGIDFVMKPLGRFFQVTETTDVRKYFLDIDKLEHFPITFVVKSAETVKSLKNGIRAKGEQQYPVAAVMEKYVACIEEIINVPILLKRFAAAVKAGHLQSILKEIIRQSKVEFNYEETSELLDVD